MDDPLFMSRFEGFGDLLGDRQRVIDGDRPLRDAVGKRRPLDQLHDQSGGAVRSFQAIDRRDVGMIERSENFRLALEACQPLRIRRPPMRGAP